MVWADGVWGSGVWADGVWFGMGGAAPAPAAVLRGGTSKRRRIRRISDDPEPELSIGPLIADLPEIEEENEDDDLLIVLAKVLH